MTPDRIAELEEVIRLAVALIPPAVLETEDGARLVAEMERAGIPGGKL